MFLEDLSLCSYHAGPLHAEAWAVPLRAVGWLEHPHPFLKGQAPEGLVAKLAAMVEEMRRNFPHHRFRGVHACSLCRGEGYAGPPIGWSQENLIVPGSSEIFAAPGGIVHYVADHDYLPPSAFLSAVMACPPCGSAEYFEALTSANKGRPVPLERSADLWPSAR